jgi:hypothetical protein
MQMCTFRSSQFAVLCAPLVLSACAAPIAPAPAPQAEGAVAAGAGDVDDEAICDAGTLRTFTRDTAKEAQARVAADIEQLERLIVARGVDGTMAAPAAQALLREVVAWEVAAARPNWDVPSGTATRRAIAAGLGGEFQNPATGKCEAFVHFDTAVVVIPPAGDFRTPSFKGVRLQLYVGDAGLRAARDTFYAHSAHAADPVFTYTRVGPIVVWRDYAVVTVNRPAEDRAAVLLPQGAGGSTYIFHRVGSEWRLLVIAKTWA